MSVKGTGGTMGIRYTLLLGKKNAPWSLGLWLGAKERSWRLSAAQEIPQKGRNVERGGTTRAQLWDTECVSLGAESNGAVLNSYQMCSFVNNFIWKSFKLNITRPLFQCWELHTSWTKALLTIWEKSFILMGAVLLKRSVETKSLA